MSRVCMLFFVYINKIIFVFFYLADYSMNKNSLCYTGIGSRRSGNHTEKQFLDVIE